MELAAYTRCSTALQEESCEEQLATIRDWASRNGHIITETYIDDGISGGKALEDRPSAQIMLADAKAKKFQGIVTKQLDRLGRDLLDMVRFYRESQRAKQKLVFVKEDFSDDPSGRLQFALLAAINQYQREDVGRKVRDHNRYLAQSGRWASGIAPLGYRYSKESKEITVDDERVPDIIAVFQAFVDNLGNCSAAARSLNNAGVRTLPGGMWRDDSVKVAVSNPLYRGYIRYQEIRTPVEIPRIIPEPLIVAADALISQSVTQSRSASNVYTYSRLIQCSVCGHGYKLGQVRVNGYQIWRCRGRKEKGVCDAPAISSNTLDRAVGEALAVILDPHKAAMREAAEHRPQKKNKRKDNLQSARKRLVDAYVSGLLEKSDFAERLQAIDAQIGNEVEEPQVDIRRTLDVNLADIVGTWNAMPPPERRGLLMLLEVKLALNTHERVLSVWTVAGEARVCL